MCGRPDCVYCEIIELPSFSKLYIHYNSLFTPLWIEFNSEATNTNERYFPQNRKLKEVHLETKVVEKHLEENDNDFIDGGYGIRLSRNWRDLMNTTTINGKFFLDAHGNYVPLQEDIKLEYEELS